MPLFPLPYFSLFLLVVQSSSLVCSALSSFTSYFFMQLCSQSVTVLWRLIEIALVKNKVLKSAKNQPQNFSDAHCNISSCVLLDSVRCKLRFLHGPRKSPKSPLIHTGSLRCARKGEEQGMWLVVVRNVVWLDQVKRQTCQAPAIYEPCLVSLCGHGVPSAKFMLRATM